MRHVVRQHLPCPVAIQQLEPETFLWKQMEWYVLFQRVRSLQRVFYLVHQCQVAVVRFTRCLHFQVDLIPNVLIDLDFSIISDFSYSIIEMRWIFNNMQIFRSSYPGYKVNRSPWLCWYQSNGTEMIYYLLKWFISYTLSTVVYAFNFIVVSSNMNNIIL